MNDDATARMERTGWSLVQWTTRLAIVLGIAGIIFGLLFYFAHQAEPLAAKLPYAISADKPGAGGASQYLLAGTVASVDTASKTIRILGSDGREYVFALNSYGVVLTGPASGDFSAKGIAAFTGDKVAVAWPDARSLDAVEQAYEQNKAAPLNQNAGGSLILKTHLTQN